MARVASTGHVLTDDEKKLIVEARVHLDRMDKSPSAYNTVWLIRKHYPGRGGKLTNQAIHAEVERLDSLANNQTETKTSKEKQQQHDETRGDRTGHSERGV